MGYIYSGDRYPDSSYYDPDADSGSSSSGGSPDPPDPVGWFFWQWGELLGVLAVCVMIAIFILIRPHAPNITDVDPGSSYTSGAVVTISGANFGRTKGSVTFDSSEATSILSWSNTSIKVVVPASVHGMTYVVVTTNKGKHTRLDDTRTMYTYLGELNLF